MLTNYNAWRHSHGKKQFFKYLSVWNSFFPRKKTFSFRNFNMQRELYEDSWDFKRSGVVPSHSSGPSCFPLFSRLHPPPKKGGRRVLFNLSDDARENNCTKTIASVSTYLRVYTAASTVMNFRANDIVFTTVFNIAPYLLAFCSRARFIYTLHAISMLQYAVLLHVYSDAEIPAPSTTSTTQSPYYATLSTKKNGN